MVCRITIQRPGESFIYACAAALLGLAVAHSQLRRAVFRAFAAAPRSFEVLLRTAAGESLRGIARGAAVAAGPSSEATA